MVIVINSKENSIGKVSFLCHLVSEFGQIFQNLFDFKAIKCVLAYKWSTNSPIKVIIGKSIIECGNLWVLASFLHPHFSYSVYCKFYVESIVCCSVVTSSVFFATLKSLKEVVQENPKPKARKNTSIYFPTIQL